MATAQISTRKKTASKTAPSGSAKKPPAKKRIAKTPAVKKSAAKTKTVSKKTSAPKAAKPAASKTDRKSAVAPEERYKMIAAAAYLRAERRGFASGHALDDWIAAEAEIDVMLKV